MAAWDHVFLKYDFEYNMNLGMLDVNKITRYCTKMIRTEFQ